MNKLLANKALAVGALVAAALTAALLILTFIQKGGYADDESYLVRAYFSDATGLTFKSRAQIAGIQVGEVVKISLEGQKARLDIRVKNEVDLRKDACLTKTFPSALMPDALLEVVAGSPGQPSLASLPEAERVITCVREAASIQQLVDGMSRIAADVQLVTADIARTVGGSKGSMREIIENLAALTRRLDATVAANEGRLSSILANVDVISRDVRELTQGEKEHVRAVVRNVEELTRQLKGVAASVQAVVDGAGPAGKDGGAGKEGVAGKDGAAGKEGRDAVAAQANGVKQAVEKINANLARLDELLAKLQEGKSVGSRLLVDEKMGRELASTVEAASSYVEKLDKLQIEVQLRSEWLLNQTGAKTYFGARLLPRPDKYYLFEVVSDPRGVDTVTTETVTTRDPATGTDSTTVATRTKHEEKLTFTLQMAKRYGPMTFRVGVIESSGGVGTDLHLFDDALQFSVSVYQFSRPYQNVFPRAKVWLNYQFLQHFYFTAGADDFLNVWREGRYPGGPKFTLGNDVFFGGGLFFTDDDLKTLLGVGGGSVISSVGSNR